VNPPKPAKPESRIALVRRARRINRELAELYPDAHTELNFSSPLELLVATILSAQTTDKRVNLVTPVLFARYKTAADYAAADREDMERRSSSPPASTGPRRPASLRSARRCATATAVRSRAS